MKAIGVFCTFVVWTVASVSCVWAKDAADPREKLETAIPEAIKLLEKEEFETFLEKFVPPDDLKKITAKTPLSEMAKGFGERKALRLLKILKAANGNKPTIDADGKTAVYELKEPVEGKMDISFIKVGKLWYLKN